MYKLIIVEDEDNIRHSLERYFPWNELGFEVVNTFSDGFGAVEYIKENPCDAVLTDIRMERMDGLEMIHALCEICPDIRVVILSGYSNFEFAQKAIRFRVVDYLLKPVDEEQLIEVFQKLKEQMDTEKRENSSENNKQELEKLVRQNLFRNLLKGQLVSKDELLVYLQFGGIEEKCVDCPMIAFQIKLTKESEEEENFIDFDRMELNNTLHQYFSVSEGAYQHFLYDEWDDKWFVAILCQEQRKLEEIQKYCKDMMQELNKSLKPPMKGKLSHSLTKRASRMSDLLRQEDTGERQNKVTWQKAEQNNLYQKSVLDYKLLVIELDIGSQETVSHVIDNMILGMRGVTIEQVKFVVKNLYSAMETEYAKRKVDLRNLTNGKFSYDKFNQFESFDSIATCVRDDFCNLSEKIKEIKLHKDSGIIDSIIDYLHEHIDDEIAHNFIAEKFRIHPGYLSRLFKETTGETLSGYSNRIKMERAAKLLKDDRYKINEISVMVGYTNTSHFSFAFRKYTGYSPSEYRQRVILL